MTAEPDPAVAACLQRTRRDIVIVLAVTASFIAAGLLVLRAAPDRPPPAPDGPDTWFRWGLIGVFIASYAARRILAGRQALRAPATRAAQFRKGHALSAIVGALAAPLGMVYAFVLQPNSNELTPFWVVALAAGALAYPRGYELEDFEEPMPGPGPSSGRLDR